MICFSVKRFRFMGLPPWASQKWKVPVRNAPDIGEKVKQTKTDAFDARILARMGAAWALEPDAPVSPEL